MLSRSCGGLDARGAEDGACPSLRSAPVTKKAHARTKLNSRIKGTLSTLNSRILIIRTPLQRHPKFRKPPFARRQSRSHRNLIVKRILPGRMREIVRCPKGPPVDDINPALPIIRNIPSFP